MCLSERNDFDSAFTPAPAHVSFLKGMIFGSREAHPGNEGDFCVYSGWIVRELPRPRANLEALLDAGFVFCVSEQHDGAVTYGLTEGAERWCEENGIIPATRAAREESDPWIDALVFDRKRRRIPGLRRSFKRTVKTTSEFVKQISYTPEEAAGAYENIKAMEANGYISERSAAAFKAHITRRIAKIAA